MELLRNGVHCVATPPQERSIYLRFHPQNALMEPSHLQYFATYLAQGVGRISKEYLKGSATVALAHDRRAMQLFYNLLPEFGSLPWTLKPFVVLGIEQFSSATGTCIAMALSALLTGTLWLCLTLWEPQGVAFLLCTGLVSLCSAAVDGLVDGRISAESTDSEKAARLQYLCQTGQTLGALYVGGATWAFALSKRTSLLLTAGLWVAVAPVTIWAAGLDRGTSAAAAAAKAPFSMRQGVVGTAGALANRAVLLVAVLGFVVCLSPALDTFLFRKYVLGLADAQQPLVSVAGTCGWFLGTSAYKWGIAKGRTPEDALRVCLCAWPLSSMATAAFAALALPGPYVLWLAMLEEACREFGKAMTFMPTTVLQQLHSPKGCEGTAFTVMQSAGIAGMVLSRNLEWAMMDWVAVDPQLHAAGFRHFPLACVAALLWRLCTAVAVVVILVPVLPQFCARASEHRAPENEDQRRGTARPSDVQRAGGCAGGQLVDRRRRTSVGKELS